MEAIRIQSFVAATPAAVWDVLLGRPEVVLDALPIRVWPDPREERAPERLAVRWPFASGGEAATRVELALTPVSGGTRVDLRHEGWQDAPGGQDLVAGHFAGWLQALAALGLLVETGRDARASAAPLGAKERYFASAEIPAGADAVWRALTDPAVRRRWSEGALDDTELIESVEGRMARWKLSAAGPRELVVVLRPTPRGTHCAVAEYGVTDRSASVRWPKMLERLARFLQ